METDGTGTLKNAFVVPVIDTTRCSGCGRCVAVCPKNLISLEVAGFRKYAEIHDSDRCDSCGCCVVSCPLAAVS